MPTADEPADFGRWASLLFVTVLTFAIVVGFSGVRFTDFGPTGTAPSASWELPADQIYQASIHGVVKIIAYEPQAASALPARRAAAAASSSIAAARSSPMRTWSHPAACRSTACS